MLSLNKEYCYYAAVFRIADHVCSDDADRPWWTMVPTGPTWGGISWSVCGQTAVCPQTGQLEIFKSYMHIIGVLQ